jgi:single-stranded DNA-binding protein
MGRGREVGFINVSVFGNAGQAAAEHLSKDWLVAVDGRLKYGQWQTEGGEKRHDYLSAGRGAVRNSTLPHTDPPPDRTRKLGIGLGSPSLVAPTR